ncbi:MAG TPA: hypothetical protein VFS00_13650 [Polyangiaceae bacterium]|nr:hypothetical protein [Polyangiaceae bacterium]
MSDPDDSKAPNPLFAAVVEACGLSSIFAPGTVRRALRDVGSTPQAAGPDTYARALPALEARLRAFLEPREVEEALRRIQTTIGRTVREV